MKASVHLTNTVIANLSNTLWLVHFDKIHKMSLNSFSGFAAGFLAQYTLHTWLVYCRHKANILLAWPHFCMLILMANMEKKNSY